MLNNNEGNPDDGRYLSPLLSDAQWHEALMRNGFSGADIALHDMEGSAQTFSTIVTTASSMEEDTQKQSHTILVTSRESDLQVDIASAFTDKLASCSGPRATHEVVRYEDIDTRDTRKAICIFLLELDAPFLKDISEPDFRSFKEVLESVGSALWITGRGDDINAPDTSLVTGLGRSINSESSHLQFVELAIEGSLSCTDTASLIWRAYESLLNDSPETEYVGGKGSLLIPRVAEDNSLTDFVRSKTRIHKATLRPLKQDGHRPLKVMSIHPAY